MTIFVAGRREGERLFFSRLFASRKDAESWAARQVAEGDFGFHVAEYEVGFEARGLYLCRRSRADAVEFAGDPQSRSWESADP